MKFPTLAVMALAIASLHAADEVKSDTTATVAPTSAPAPLSPTPEVKPLTPEQQQQAFFLLGLDAANRAQFVSIVDELELSDAELESFISGIRSSLKGERLTFDPNEIIPSAQKMLSERAAAKAKRVAEKNKEIATKNALKNEEFLAKVDADKEIIKSSTGLRYKILVAGTDPKPAATSTVKCRYTGKFTDGKVFDSTTTRNNEPTEFPLNGVIPAWTEAVQKIGKGGKILLFAPADLAYGEQGQGPIPPNSLLEFEVELVDFK